MTEAAKYGYAVDRTTLDRALKYLRGSTFDNPLTLAYAQYVLALGGTPDRGAMNRLREKSAQAGSNARWLLAAAYAPRRQPEGGRRADCTDRQHGGSEGRPL